MQKLIFILFFCISFIHTNIYVSAQEIKLAYNPSAGTEFITEYDIQSNIDQTIMGIEQGVSAKTFMVIHSLVKENNPEYSLVEITYNRLAVETSTGMFSVVIDSDSDEENNPVNNALKTLINKPFYAKFSPQGDLLSIKGIKEVLDKVVNNLDVEDEMQQVYSNLINQSFGEENLTENFQQFNLSFPDYPVKMGDSWSYDQNANSSQFQLILQNTATLSGKVTNGYRIILKSEMSTPAENVINMEGFEAKMEMKGSQVGEIVVDPKTGISKSGMMSQELDGLINVQITDEGDPISIPINIKTSIRLKTTFL